ncbi:hypothetical protein EVAR_100595_1 [Eumeta japonica]|uniref:Uncharacterized protein n=1 Tax=Eumeta variegata TaxID=151549 RepID=A0A4C2A2P1_EUMVA|nr:hypothetical protein EVAR_100595_1 [Eumeta japonica]
MALRCTLISALRPVSSIHKFEGHVAVFGPPPVLLHGRRRTTKTTSDSSEGLGFRSLLGDPSLLSLRPVMSSAVPLHLRALLPLAAVEPEIRWRFACSRRLSPARLLPPRAATEPEIRGASPGRAAVCLWRDRYHRPLLPSPRPVALYPATPTIHSASIAAVGSRRLCCCRCCQRL